MPKIGVEVTKSQVEKAVQITDGSTASGTASTALKGTASALYSTAIGNGAEASGTNSTAIGNGAKVTGTGAVQIGNGTNTENASFKFRDTVICNANGKIPFSALQDNEVVGLSVNASNHLIVTYANGTTADLGAIGGGGKAISDIEMGIAGAQGKLKIVYADGTTQHTSAYIGAVLPTGAGGSYELKSVPELATYFDEKITGLENGYRFTVDGVDYIGKETIDSNGNPIFEYEEVE